MIIDDVNAYEFAAVVADPSQPDFSGGYDASLYSDEGLSAVCTGDWNGEIYRENQWEDLIQFHEENNSSPDHHHIAAGCKILNQKRTNYCWIHGVVGAMQVAIAQSGEDPPHLAAAATGTLIKNGRNVGGWGAEAVSGLEKTTGKGWGVPTVDVYPEGVIDLALAKSQKVRENAVRFNEFEFLKLPTERGVVPLEVVASVLLNEKDPMAFSTGFPWWGHLTFHSKFGRANAQWGCINPNSWGYNWGNKGKSFILFPKCCPAEGIAVRRVREKAA